jgi:hypothetical protein
MHSRRKAICITTTRGPPAALDAAGLRCNAAMTESKADATPIAHCRVPSLPLPRPDRVPRMSLHAPPEPPPPLPGTAFGAVLRTLLRLAVVVALAWLIHLATDWVMAQTETLKSGTGLRIGLVGVMLLAYALLLAVPFVPGVELGISLMVIIGPAVAPLVYLATVLGLMLAFSAGRLVPYAYLHKVFADLRLRGTCAMLERLQPLDGAARLAALQARLPRRIAPHATRHRYLLLAVLFNLPGASVIGGGGGIALMAGLSGLFGWRATLLTIVLAVSPVPIMVVFFNWPLLG